MARLLSPRGRRPAAGRWRAGAGDCARHGRQAVVAADRLRGRRLHWRRRARQGGQRSGIRGNAGFHGQRGDADRRPARARVEGSHRRRHRRAARRRRRQGGRRAGQAPGAPGERLAHRRLSDSRGAQGAAQPGARRSPVCGPVRIVPRRGRRRRRPAGGQPGTEAHCLHGWRAGAVAQPDGPVPGHFAGRGRHLDGQFRPAVRRRTVGPGLLCRRHVARRGGARAR